ncbi:hypothetical protein DL96DRAFT_1037072 [Flagelloscypha sp. PMI_526]|nr:hypothetical protein DL96DRAFT_1037072 [Flagelloscypha sp. PMI_526]
MSSKGKGRATERTPLLDGEEDGTAYASTSADNIVLPESHTTTSSFSSRHQSIWVTIRTVFFSTLAVLVLVIAILAIMAWSYAHRVSRITTDEILATAVQVRIPESLDVMNITEDGSLWLRVGAHIGVDAGEVLGVHDDRQNDGFFTLVWKSLGRWGIRTVDKVTVQLDTFNISSYHTSYPYPTLVQVTSPPVEVSLADDPEPGEDWLQPVMLDVLVKPTNRSQDLLSFAGAAWRHGYAMLGARIPHVSVHGGGLGDHSWRSNLISRSMADIQQTFSISIPAIPGFPQPGKNVPFPDIGDLITLESFSIVTTGRNLALSGLATIINPIPPVIDMTAPAFPFDIALPTEGSSSVPIASLRSLPFPLTHPNVSVRVEGSVVPLSPTPAARAALSTFLGRFLSAKDNAILITTPLIPHLPPAPAIFPALSPPPHVLRNLTIKDMRFTPTTTPEGDTIFYASGLINAHVVLPKGFNVNIDVRYVLPDVLVFDGKVPEEVGPYHSKPLNDDDDKLPAPPAPPLPDPLPERAFGRIRPEYWLLSNSTVDVDNDGSEGSAYLVTARIESIPMDILPGRENQFSKFVQKVIFGNGALAGIQGSAGVRVKVYGLPIGDGNDDEPPPDMNLSGLPFKGEVLIGRKMLLDTGRSTFVRWMNVVGMTSEAHQIEQAVEGWREQTELILRQMKRVWS